MRFKIEITVDYDETSVDISSNDMEYKLKKELDRHIQDGLLLYDHVVDQYSAEVNHIGGS